MLLVMKKDILIVFPFFDIGGSTTSAINFLNNIDTDKYNVDLICQYAQNPYLKFVNNKINFLGCAKKKKTIFALLIKIRILMNINLIKFSIKKSIKEKKIAISFDYLQWLVPKLYSRLDKKYDVAIGFMEGWSNAYILSNVNAMKRFAWIHTNYKDAKLNSEVDYPFFREFDYIVSVSEACKKSFDEIFPTLFDKSIVIENIIDSDIIKKQSNEFEIQKDYTVLNIVTMCRLSIYTKGLDFIVECAKKLVDTNAKFLWHIVGDGIDEDIFRSMIVQNGLQNNFRLYGKKLNPYPYLKQADIFVLASRYEGKPISVTEAMILNIPVVVSNYAEAHNQVKNNITGFVLDDIDNQLFELLYEFCNNRNRLEHIKANLSKENFTNKEELKKLDRLF